MNGPVLVHTRSTFRRRPQPPRNFADNLFLEAQNIFGEAVRLRDEGSSPVWLPDSRHLLYESGSELHLLDTVSRVDRIIMRTAPYELELGTRSGGARDWIHYSLISKEADIWSFELQ